MTDGVRQGLDARMSRAVEAMEHEGLARIAHELIDRLGGARRADLAAAFTHRVAFLVISRMLGIPAWREDVFRDWAVGFLEYPRDPAHSRRCAALITEYLLPIIAERRREPREDAISALVLADAEGHRLTDEEILAHIRLLFSAGASTTTDALGNLLYALLGERSRWERVLAEPALREGAIEVSWKEVTPGREYVVTVKPKSTNDVMLGAIKIETDSKIPKYQRQLAFFSIVRKPDRPAAP